jgi:hypothetical protein
MKIRSAFVFWAGLAVTGAPAQVVSQGNPASADKAWPVRNIGSLPAVQTTWTSATPVDTALTLSSILGYGTVVLTIDSTADADFVAQFEGSGASGSRWSSLTCVPLFAPGFVTAADFYGVDQESYLQFTCPVAGLARFRVRLLGAFLGGGSSTLTLQAVAADSRSWVVPIQQDQTANFATVYPPPAGNKFEVKNATASDLKVDGSSVTQPVSAASLPLPTGAAQEHTTAGSPSSVRLSDGSGFYKATTPSDTQPVSAASLPLPTGASTDRTTAAGPFSVRLSNGSSFITPTTPSDTQPVAFATGTPFSGQQAVTASAAALPSNAARAVCVKAASSNAISVYIGPSGVSTSTGLELEPGDKVCAPVANSNVLYVVASTTGASVSFMGVN